MLDLVKSSVLNWAGINNNNNQSLIYVHIYIRPKAQEQKNSVQVIRNTAHRPMSQASYTASRVRLKKEIQPWWRELQLGSQYHFLISAKRDLMDASEMLGCFSSGAKKFQNFGPETAKLRGPIRTVRVQITVKSPWAAISQATTVQIETD